MDRLGDIQQVCVRYICNYRGLGMKDKIKTAWIVCGMDTNPTCKDNGDVEEFSTERAAVKRAKLWVQTTEDTEAWIFRLSHVVSRPDAEPQVEIVK